MPNMASSNDQEIFEKELTWRINYTISQDTHMNSFLIQPFNDVAIGCFTVCHSLGEGKYVFHFEVKKGCEATDNLLMCTLRVHLEEDDDYNEYWFEKPWSWSNRNTSPFELNTYKSEGVNLPPGVYTIRISFRIKLTREGRQPDMEGPSISMAEFVTPWLGNESFSDASIVCEDKTFNCHKIILAGRSEVLNRMLSSQLKEGKESRVEIKGFEPDMVEPLIKYIYTDKVGEESSSWELFEAAKMYEIHRLQELCLKYLRKNISIHNCCRMLDAAMIHELDDYFNFAMEFFKNNKNEVVNTDGWTRIETNSALLSKIITHQI